MKDTFSLEDLKSDAIAEAASVIALAMINNPLHIAVFGNNNIKTYIKHLRLFKKVLSHKSCNIKVIKKEDRIIGVMNYYKPGQCQIDLLTTIKMLPGLFWSLRVVLFKILKWKSIWGKHDLATPHFHFGPLAVLPEMQDKGIGSALLKAFCKLVDYEEADAYLETDKPENVRLYEMHGFKTVSSQKVFGVENWFMHRAYTKPKY